MRVQETPYRFYTPQRDTRPQITLMDEAGELVVEKPTSDPVHGGNQVIWWIDNQSARPHRIEVRNFRPKGGGTVDWPFQDPPPQPVDVPPGESRRIKLKTLDRGPNNKKGTWAYEYDVVVDNQPLEPEIVIEWPPV